MQYAFYLFSSPYIFSMLLVIVILVLQFGQGLSCPSGCSCGTDYRECQDVTKSDKFLPSSLVIKVWLKDSYVDVEKLMDVFPNLQFLPTMRRIREIAYFLSLKIYIFLLSMLTQF